MTGQERIREKLVELASYIGDLEKMRDLSWAEFQVDVMLRRGIERTLQVAVECALDAGNMLISLNEWRAPESNRDVFLALAEQGILRPPLVERFVKMASFRNILVHEYTRVDPAIVYALLRESPEDLRRFRDSVAESLRQPEA